MRFVYYAKSIELRVVNYIMLSRAYARGPVTYRDAQSGPVAHSARALLIMHCALRVAY